jgi:hypothetical protein
MPFMNKTKPGLMSRMFSKNKPQPTSPLAADEKVIGNDGEVVEPTAGGASSKGSFASRRSARTENPAADIIDVEPVLADEPAPSAAPVPDVAEPSAGSPNSIENMFKSRKGAEKPAPAKQEPTLDSPGTEAIPPSQPTKAKGLFGRKAAGGVAAAAAAAGDLGTKKKKSSKKAGKFGGPKNVVLLTELGDSGKQLIWSMGATTLTQLPTTPAPEEVISFSKEDVRFHTDAPMPYSKAQDMAIEELGEMVALVNRSKDLAALYTTREDRATASPYRIAPGQQALDILLKKTGRVGQSLVTGFSLKDESGKSSVVVLYSVTAEGESSKPQVTVNPDNMEFVLSQFTSSRKINRKETEVVLYTNEDLLSVIGDVKFFANEKVWNGIPIRVLQNVGAGVTGLVAAGAVAWAAAGFTQKQLLVSENAKVQSTAKALTEKNTHVIEASMYSFASSLSEDQARMFSLAQQVWVPSSTVIAEMKTSETKITVVLPLAGGAMFNNGPSVNAVTSPLRVQQLYEKEAPEGCTKSQPQTTGNLNEIRIDIVCQSLDTPFHRYRGD